MPVAGGWRFTWRFSASSRRRFRSTSWSRCRWIIRFISAHYDIGSVEYTPRVAEDFGALSAPALDGITLDGRLAVVYSRFDLGNGWEQFPHAYSYGYSDRGCAGDRHECDRDGGDALSVNEALVKWSESRCVSSSRSGDGQAAGRRGRSGGPSRS